MVIPLSSSATQQIAQKDRSRRVLSKMTCIRVRILAGSASANGCESCLDAGHFDSKRVRCQLIRTSLGNAVTAVVAIAKSYGQKMQAKKRQLPAAFKVSICKLLG